VAQKTTLPSDYHRYGGPHKGLYPGARQIAQKDIINALGITGDLDSPSGGAICAATLTIKTQPRNFTNSIKRDRKNFVN
jgi:hypothetical protein